MDIFYETLLSGLAVAYVVELLGFFWGLLLPAKKAMQHVATVPAAFFSCWLFGMPLITLIICSLAAAFLSTSLRILLDRVTSTPQVVNPYRRW